MRIVWTLKNVLCRPLATIVVTAVAAVGRMATMHKKLDEGNYIAPFHAATVRQGSDGAPPAEERVRETSTPESGSIEILLSQVEGLLLSFQVAA